MIELKQTQWERIRLPRLFLYLRIGARPGETGLLGVSTGGILGGTLLALEPELDAGILILAGGDVPNLLLNSSESRVSNWCRHRIATDRGDLRGPKLYLRSAGIRYLCSRCSERQPGSHGPQSKSVGGVDHRPGCVRTDHDSFCHLWRWR